MGLVKEPKGIDLSVNSSPWNEKDLADFRELIKKEKARVKGKLQKT